MPAKSELPPPVELLPVLVTPPVVMADPPAVPSPAVIGNVAVRLPDFWVEDPEFWFLQAEAVFETSRVVQSITKYNHCLAKLPSNVATTVKELARRVAAGGVGDPYQELRTKLLGSFQKSSWQLGFELLDVGDLGDCRPSVLMDAMLALLPPGCNPDYVFLCLFLRRLPADMRDQLAAQNIVDPAAMALAANRIFDARQQPGFRAGFRCWTRAAWPLTVPSRHPLAAAQSEPFQHAISDPWSRWGALLLSRAVRQQGSQV